MITSLGCMCVCVCVSESAILRDGHSFGLYVCL